MRIDESRVFVFQFDTPDMGGITFPIRAQSREEAADNLQKCLMRIQSELAMEFPKMSPINSVGQIGVTTPPAPTMSAEEGLSEILVERIETLMKDLGATGLTPASQAETIKNWTDLTFEPENYSAIVRELELIASGAKDVPVKGKKK